MTLLAKERGGPPIKFQVLFYPVADANFDTPSYMTYQNGYWLTRDAMKWYWNNYLTNQTNVKDPTVSPLQTSIDQLKGLPPALIINGENDVLRDEGEAYALKLLEAGVPVTAVRYHGTIHDFVMLNVIGGQESLLNELLARIIEAHGGMDRWKTFEKVEVTIVSGGGLFSLKGRPQDPTTEVAGSDVWLHDELTSILISCQLYYRNNNVKRHTHPYYGKTPVSDK